MKVELEFSPEQIEEIAQKAAAKALNEFKAHYSGFLQQNTTQDIAGIDMASEVTGLSRATIYKRSSLGTIPVMRKGGKLYFSRKKLTEWIQSGEKKTVSEALSECEGRLSKPKP